MNKFNLIWKNKGKWQPGDPVWNAEMSQKITDTLNELIDNITKINQANDDILYENIDGLATSGSSSKSVSLKESVLNFSAILIQCQSGFDIVSNKLNDTNVGSHELIAIYWYNNGKSGTFYNNTIYKVIGLGRKKVIE